MEMFMSSERVMEELVRTWNEAHANKTYAWQGVVGLYFGEEYYFLVIGEDQLYVVRHTSCPVVLSVFCSFKDWIALLSGRLLPWWGVISGRLIFKGKTIYLRQLPRVDFSTYLCDLEDQADRFEEHPSRYWKVPERVLVINASPRKERGYTSLLSGHLCRGMRQVVRSVEVVEMEDFKIEACCGCWHCWTQSEGECIYDHRDDGRRLLNLMDESDLIVFAFPLYSDGMPSGLKKLLDRRIAALKPQMVPGKGKTRHPRRRVKNQAIAVLSVCGFVEKAHFLSIKAHFRALAHNWHTPLIGEIYRSAAMALFSHPLYYSVQQEVLTSIEDAGKELVCRGRIAGCIRRKIECNFLSSRKFRACANYFWEKSRK